MFEGFQEKRSSGRGRYLVSFLTAALVYGGAGALVFALAARPVEEEEPPVEVTFAPPPAPAPPPPPPPPAPAAEKPKPKAPRPARPVEPLREPEKVPDKPPPEAEPTKEDPGPPGPGDGEGGGGVPGGTGTGPPAPPAPPPPPPAKPKSVPQNLPDGAEPAVPDDRNVTPEFPEAARKQGVEGLVILKIVVSETGAVKDVQVMKGEEPFVSAAVAAVKTWRYKPASFQGEPIAVFKIVKVPFKLSAR
jgi:protein TonB